MTELTHLSLFSGIGGLDLAAEAAGFTSVGQCEWADYPTKVLEKHWPNVPRWRDIRTLTGDDFYARTGRRSVTVLSAGFPCQPHSLCGHRKASDDERDLWPDTFRCIREIKPRWFIGENVPGLLTSEDGRFFGRVLRDLALGGYFAGWVCLPAHAVGAPFWGERVAIVAASDSVRRDCLDKGKQVRLADINLESDAWKASRSAYLPFHVEWAVSEPERGIHRNDDGLPFALDRLKCLGNAVVPQQFYPFFKFIAEIEESAYWREGE